MSRGINRKTVRRSIVRAHQSGVPVTGVDLRSVSVCLLGQLEAHPSQRQQIQEIVEALVASDDLNCRLVHKDAVLRPLTHEERAAIQDERQKAARKSVSWTCRPARTLLTRSALHRQVVVPDDDQFDRNDALRLGVVNPGAVYAYA